MPFCSNNTHSISLNEDNVIDLKLENSKWNKMFTSHHSNWCQGAPLCLMSTQTKSADRSQVQHSYRHVRIKPLLSLPPHLPLQYARSTALILPWIFSIHLYLGNEWDFLCTFICTPTSITPFFSVTVCFALNLLLLFFPPFFIPSLTTFYQSVQWEVWQHGYTDIREQKSILFIVLFYHQCAFFFYYFSSHHSSVLPLKRIIIIFKKVIGNVFLIWYVPFVFKINNKNKAMPSFHFCLKGLEG